MYTCTTKESQVAFGFAFQEHVVSVAIRAAGATFVKKWEKFSVPTYSARVLWYRHLL